MSKLVARVLQALGVDPDRHRIDLWLVVGFALFAAVGSAIAVGATDVRLYDGRTMDTWFEGDIPRVVDNLSNRFSVNVRAKVHPLFAILGRAPIVALEALGIDRILAIQIWLVSVSVMWVILFFCLLRTLGCDRPGATVFTLLACGSAAAMFWLVVPETYGLGSVSIILALVIVSWTRSHRYREWVDIAVSAFSLSITVTNWMFGILATLARRPWKRAAQISVNAFALVVLVWAVQKKLFPTTYFFLGNPAESGHIFSEAALGFWHTTRSFLFHSLVMPAIHLIQRPGAGEWPVMLTQPALPGSGTGFGLAAVMGWSLLLGTGVWTALRKWRRSRAVLVLTLGIVLQFTLHTAFGDETFLYSLNFLPLLVAFAALGTLGPGRRIVLGVAGATTLLTGINNVIQFERARTLLTAHTELHHDASDEYRRRLERDPMPDPDAIEGGPWYEAGYERGGGLGLSLGSFSIAFWSVDPETGAVTPNYQLPELENQELPAVFELPGRRVRTPHYEAEWQYTNTRRWELAFDVPTGNVDNLFVVIRSIGPRVSPVRDLRWESPQLTINDRWQVEVTPAADVTLTDERQSDWVTVHGGAPSHTSSSGWGVAKIGPLTAGRWQFVFFDPTPTAPRDLFLKIVE